MTQQNTPPPQSNLSEKIAKISARLEESTPKFNGAMDVVPPTGNTQPVGRHAKPWERES